uniref:Photoreceptor disc component n=1 Tax=Ornithorhynchus anatinus TaxID=9258 RepID=A0A6I8NVR4_ORNAN
MCTTFVLLSALALLWRRHFGNRVQPCEPQTGPDRVSWGEADPAPSLRRQPQGEEEEEMTDGRSETGSRRPGG